MTLRADIRIRRDGFSLAAMFIAEPGEPCALIGPNGSGKSTVAAALAGILRLDAGSVQLFDKTLDNGRRALCPQRRNVGVVFQDRLLFPKMSVRDNVGFGLRARGQSRLDADKTASKWLDRLDLTAIADKHPPQLSGGQAQRVAIARALAIEPDLLILDEPMAALDPESKPAVRRLIAQALDDFPGVSLCITHDPVEARALARRIAVIEAGAIVQVGSSAQLQRTPRSAFAAAFVGINLFQGVISCSGDKPVVLDARRCGQHEDAAPPVAIRIASPDQSIAPDRSEVFASLHPRAIILGRDKPQTSARNAHRCAVESIDPIEGALRVSLTGPITLTAEITDAARADLDLTPGSTVWASFKATEVHVYRR